MKSDNQIFIHRLLKAIADSIIMIFIPLYILKDTNNINLSLFYLIAYSLFVIFFIFILKRFIQKFGVLAIMLHFIPIIITEGILSFFPINITTIILSSLFMGLAQALYSVPLNLVFAFNDKKTNVGKFQIATNIGKLFFILLSGYILSSSSSSSFLILSIFSSIIYILSSLPLLFSYKSLINNYNNVSILSPNVSKIKIDPLYILFHISFGLFQVVMDNLVPLFLYINNLSFQTVTILIALIELIKIFVNYLSQLLVSRKKALLCVILGSIIFFISVIGMIFIKNNIALYILSTISSISFPLTFVPMFRLYCNYLRKKEIIFNGITRRDIEIFSFRPSLYALGYIGFGLYPCLILGIIVLPIMLYSEIKLLKFDKEK